MYYKKTFDYLSFFFQTNIDNIGYVFANFKNKFKILKLLVFSLLLSNLITFKLMVNYYKFNHPGLYMKLYGFYL